jgi:hypothetical protein
MGLLHTCIYSRKILYIIAKKSEPERFQCRENNKDFLYESDGKSNKILNVEPQTSANIKTSVIFKFYVLS